MTDLEGGCQVEGGGVEGEGLLDQGGEGARVQAAAQALAVGVASRSAGANSCRSSETN